MKTIAAATMLLLIGLNAQAAQADACTYITEPMESFTPDLTSDRCFVITMSEPLTINNPVNAPDGTEWTLLVYNINAYQVSWGSAYKSNMMYSGGDGGNAFGRIFSLDSLQYMNTLLTQ